MARITENWPMFVAYRMVRSLGHGGWFLTVSLLTLAGLFGSCVFLWHEYRDEILDQDHYRLSAENLNVLTPVPDWVKSDIKADAVVRGRLQGADIRQRDLGQQIFNAFLGNPWVREVKFVNKSTLKAGVINIDLTYRKPIAMVLVNARRYGVDFEVGLFPIDVEGRLLPKEFTVEEANRYPKIDNVNSHPRGTVGEPWGDKRVIEAAKIIHTLSKVWSNSNLYRIDCPDPSPLQQPGMGDFILVTLDGKTHRWGGAIDQKDEPLSSKLARLRSFLKQPDSSKLTPVSSRN